MIHHVAWSLACVLGVGVTRMACGQGTSGPRASIELVSTEVLLPGETPPGYSFCTISDDGRFVAYSTGPHIDLERKPEHYYVGTGMRLADRQSGQVIAIEPLSAGPRACRFELPTISGDGAFVAFVSTSEQLAPGDTNGVADVFVWCRATGAFERVSVSSDGAQGCAPSGRYALRSARPSRTQPGLIQDTDGEITDLAISADGRFVAFASSADNLVEDDTNGRADVFVRDRLLGTTVRVSVSSSGAQGIAGNSHDPAMTPDGRLIAFVSDADGLDGPRDNGRTQVYVRDMQRGITECITRSPRGLLASGDSEAPSFSADGRFVCFVSQAMDLVSGDRDDRLDVFIRDLSDMSIQRVESGDPETEFGCHRCSWQEPSLSHDGTFLAFSPWVSHHPDDRNRTRDVYVLNRRTGRSHLISRSLHAGCPPANGISGRVTTCITPDGRHVAFPSIASDMVRLDADARCDVFMAEMEWDEPAASESGTALHIQGSIPRGVRVEGAIDGPAGRGGLARPKPRD